MRRKRVARGGRLCCALLGTGARHVPVLSRMVAGSYDALSDDAGSGSGGAWSPFAPRPALSSGGSGASLVEGLASFATRSGRFGGGAQVQRQSAGTALSGTAPIIATPSFTGAAPQSPASSARISASISGIIRRISAAIKSASYRRVSSGTIAGRFATHSGNRAGRFRRDRPLGIAIRRLGRFLGGRRGGLLADCGFGNGYTHSAANSKRRHAGRASRRRHRRR